MLTLKLVNKTDFTLSPASRYIKTGNIESEPHVVPPNASGEAGAYKAERPIGGRAAVVQTYTMNEADGAIALLASKHNGLQFPTLCGCAILPMYDGTDAADEKLFDELEEKRAGEVEASSEKGYTLRLTATIETTGEATFTLSRK